VSNGRGRRGIIETVWTVARNVGSLLDRQAPRSVRGAAAVLAVLNELLSHAMYWDNEQSGTRVTTLEADSSERIEVLKRTLREDLETGGTRKGTDV
jgi:hypothetical protein